MATPMGYTPMNEGNAYAKVNDTDNKKCLSVHSNYSVSGYDWSLRKNYTNYSQIINCYVRKSVKHKQSWPKTTQSMANYIRTSSLTVPQYLRSQLFAQSIICAVNYTSKSKRVFRRRTWPVSSLTCYCNWIFLKSLCFWIRNILARVDSAYNDEYLANF